MNWLELRLMLALWAAWWIVAGVCADEPAAKPRLKFTESDWKELGVIPVAPRKDPKTGFVVGGSNATASIKALKELNGLPIQDLEHDMRPNAKSEVSSTTGFLGDDERLLDVLAADNALVVDQHRLTHGQLARHLLALAAIGQKVGEVEFLYHGVPFKVSLRSARGFQLSPFRDETRTNIDATVENLKTHQILEYSLLVPQMIERYGFYEGPGTSYRVDPALIISLLGFLDDKAAAPATNQLVEADQAELFHVAFGGPDPVKAVDAMLKDFKLANPGEFSIENGRLTMKPRPDGPMMFLRPIYGGPVVHWQAQLEPVQLDAQSTPSETRLGLVLANRQQAVLRVRGDDPKTKAAGQAELLLLDAMGNTKSLRSESLKAGGAKGKWELAYHHSLVRALRDGQPIVQAVAEVNPNTAPVVGVWIEQRSAPCAVLDLLLCGTKGPEKLEGERLEALQSAQRSTAMAAQAFGMGQFDQASDFAFEAVILWKKAKGENSADASNAAFNLAAINRAKKDAGATAASFQMALDIRRQALGETHPLTAHIRLELARHYAENGDAEKAREQAAAAEPVFKIAYGDDHELTKTVRRLAGKP